MGHLPFPLEFHSPMRFSVITQRTPIHSTLCIPNSKHLETCAFIRPKGFHSLPTFGAIFHQPSTPSTGCGPTKYFIDSSSHDQDDEDDDKKGEETLISLNDQISENEDEETENVDNIDLKIEKIGRNRRRISATIEVEAPLNAVWNILTDYERLADFIPGLAVSQLLERRENGAMLLQVGQQNLAFGLKFKAKGIVDVHENELEILPNAIRRDLDFKMVEGDFQVFEGKWCIEQVEGKVIGNQSFSHAQKFQTLLSYIVNIQPKRWLPVALVEGRLSKEIHVNLICIRKKVISTAFDALATF